MAANAALHDQVRRAVWAEVDRVGLEAFRPGVVVGDFAGCGVGQTTLFGWVRAELERGAPERIIGRVMALAGPVVNAEPGAAVHLDHLRQCVAAAADVMRAARGDDGTVRNPRILLAAADQLRQAVDVAARVAVDGARADAVTAFVAAVAEQVRLAPPAVAKQVNARLQTMCGASGQVG